MMKVLGAPNITPELKQKVVDGVLREAGGRSVEQLAQDENRILVGLLRLRSQASNDATNAKQAA
jgi:transposase-like protein